MLPVEEVLPEVRAALDRAARAVLVAPPGTGKTTLVPPALLGEAWLAGGKILLLEPRRLAARAAARRMADLAGDRLGGRVGLSTRVDREISDRTRLEVVTEGILTARLARDPALAGVGLVIFDEFHERSLEADLGLALALDAARNLRPDLRILVMSATISAAPVAAILGDAPVVRVEARTHPVEIRRLAAPPRDPIEETAVAVRAALREEEGDVLVFLPGGKEIRRVAEFLADAPASVRPLYGDLDRAAQDAALRPDPAARRVILSTDIAETSLTIEGVRVVVDSGQRRVARFDPVSGLSRLETARITRDAAEQRAGRAGRTGPGLCLRMWSRAEEAGLLPRRAPEIVGADLAGLVLETESWGTRAEDLSWISPPPPPALAAARATLAALGCLDDRGRITSRGRAAARLPFHPRLASMLFAGGELGWAEPACALAGELEEGSGARGVERARRALGRAPRRPAPPDARGVLIALAYPDRLAVRRPDGAGRYVMANGRGARLPVTSPLAREEILAVARVEGGGAEGSIRLAAPVSRASYERHLADRVALPVPGEPTERTRARVSSEAERALDLRLAYLRARGGSWPARAEDLDPARRARLDREAPPDVVVPSGRRHPLRYHESAPPALEVRIQEVFGVSESPRVGGEPIVLHLLSPAKRPVQVTRDLASFWKNTYPALRRELSRKYPRHEWPEDPARARPTARPKKRKR